MYLPYYVDPYYMFKPKVNKANREREHKNRMRERSTLMERERIDSNTAGNRYLAP